MNNDFNERFSEQMGERLIDLVSESWKIFLNSPTSC